MTVTAPLGSIVLAICLALMYFARTGLAASDPAAPADEYFGKLKMSAISVRMRIDALGRRYHARSIEDADLLHDAGEAEDSLRAWFARYPRDPWLAPTAFHLEQLYQAVQTSEARTRATAMLHFIAAEFPATSYARTSRVRLAQGFPKLHGETPVTATPNPYAPSPSPSESSPASPSPVRSGAPSPNATA